MKRVELKRIAEIFTKGNSPDEKTPFASRVMVPNNGSFSKNFEADEDIINNKKPKEFLESEEDGRLEGPMSIPRKICFVMSFNAWILYFVVLGWLIPCRKLECGVSYPDVVETNLSSMWLLTNVESLNAKGLPSLAILGYSDATEEKLTALATFDATPVWNHTLPFIPRKIQCNFESVFDANADGISDCLLSGYNDVYAFNATDGHVFWHRNIPSEEGSLLGGFHPTAIHGRTEEGFLIGTCGDKLYVLSAHNGTVAREVALPCDSPFAIKIVSNAITKNFTLWSLVCDYGDKVEAWGFAEHEVLSGRKLENKAANTSDFILLFSSSNSGGSIDLGCDVTAVPGGPLLLSWADRVAMVTMEAIAWERHFPEPLTVASIKIGHFLNSGELQIAAAVHNATSTIVYFLEMKNGSLIDYVMLNDRQAQSMDVITNVFDLLVLKSMSFGNVSQPVSNITDPIPTEETNFLLIDFSSGSIKIRDIVTTSTVVGSALSVQTNGETDLLIIKTENGITSYQKHVLHDIDSQGSVVCIGTKSRHHYSFEA